MYKLLRQNARLQCCSKFLSKGLTTQSQTKNPVLSSFDEFVRQRQQEAVRSIVVQVSSEKSYNELYNYCSVFGQIIGAHHYQVQSEENLHYILVEYASTDEASAAVSQAAYNEDQIGVPVYSPFLWFKAASKRVAKAAGANKAPDLPLNVINGIQIIDNTDLNNLLHAAKDIEAQIQVLYQNTQLNDLGIRLRFLAALQIQKAISGMFPAASAQPFGSSVNGFGKMGCDLDLILRLDSETFPAKLHSDSRLIFHTKENLSNGRSQTQRQMESIGDMLHLFLPGVCHVRRILQARVPIIKYHHEHLNLEVDLSMSNLSGFYMSELLYLFGEIDKRVRPLTFCIRRWANACGLTNPSPGRWISNFSLTCLVIFFLQQIKNPVLPTINALIKAATEADIRVTEDGINCTFGRDLDKIAFQSKNKSAIKELLLQFFEFYSQFDFQNRALSLNEGRAISKPDHSALYIVNPLEQILNVSKNVSLEECERLRIEVRNAAWVLESEVENKKIPENEKLETPWGLLNLFKSPEKSIIRPNFFFKPRMVQVSDLFEGQDKDTPQKLSANKANSKNSNQNSNSLPSTANIVDYKNSSVKQQVQQIKAQHRNDLKQLRMNASVSGASGGNSTETSTSKNRRSR